MTDRAETAKYCCEEMARWSQPSKGLIHHTAIANVPGIRLLEGSSCVVISFCPWCGKQVFDNSGLGGKRMWISQQ
jgi:hypothetical protein